MHTHSQGSVHCMLGAYTLGHPPKEVCMEALSGHTIHLPTRVCVCTCTYLPPKHTPLSKDICLTACVYVLCVCVCTKHIHPYAFGKGCLCTLQMVPHKNKPNASIFHVSYVQTKDIYSRPPVMRTPFLPNNSVLIRAVSFGEREHF